MPKAKDTEYSNRLSATAERTEYPNNPPWRRRQSTPTKRQSTRTRTATAEKDGVRRREDGAQDAVPGGEPGQQLPGSQPAHGEVRRRAARHQRTGGPELRPPEEPGGVRPEGKAGDAGGGDGSLQRGQLEPEVPDQTVRLQLRQRWPNDASKRPCFYPRRFHVVSTRKPVTAHREFDVTDPDRPEVEALVAEVQRALTLRGESETDVVLAALAEISAAYIEQSEDKNSGQDRNLGRGELT